MKIVVLVKHVPDATGERRFADDGTVDRAAADGLLSELDEYAVEQALRVADELDDVEVVALTLGPDEAAAAIKRTLQMGASAGIHVNDDAVHGTDALGTSTILAAAVRKAAPDLVICGMASTDGSMGVLPAMLAERLGWPAATLGSSLQVTPERASIRRDGDLATTTKPRDALAAEGDPPPLPGLLRDRSCDVAIVGGGYTGLWTALQLKERAPEREVVLLEQDICGGGPSGRNGGFVNAWWDELDTLEELYGAEPALSAARALSESVRAIGAWCEQQRR